MCLTHLLFLIIQDYYKAVMGYMSDSEGGMGPPMGRYDGHGYSGGGGGGGGSSMGGGGFISGGAGGAKPESGVEVEHTGVLKVRGLPFSATPEDLAAWFNGADLPLSQPVPAERSVFRPYLL